MEKTAPPVTRICLTLSFFPIFSNLECNMPIKLPPLPYRPTPHRRPPAMQSAGDKKKRPAPEPSGRPAKNPTVHFCLTWPPERRQERQNAPRYKERRETSGLRHNPAPQKAAGGLYGQTRLCLDRLCARPAESRRQISCFSCNRFVRRGRRVLTPFRRISPSSPCPRRAHGHI